MNTVQTVKKQIVEPDGSTLTLACGHRMWLAGVSKSLREYPCLMSPCYRPDIYMGDFE